MLAVNLALMRLAVAPLTHLTGLMRRVDPLRPLVLYRVAQGTRARDAGALGAARGLSRR